jgi:DNA helicase-2/ATP-dependent DNA helicase PcrA
VRLGDLERLVGAADRSPDLAAFVAELTLDPPASTGDLAGPPTQDDDYLVLSTVHSAKGLEWPVVHVLHLVDGAFPSDMALARSEGIEEEARLFYVAVTRAADELHLYAPLRMPHHRHARDDRHSIAPISRFLDDAALDTLDVVDLTPPRPAPVRPQTSARVKLPDLDELWA